KFILFGESDKIKKKHIREKEEKKEKGEGAGEEKDKDVKEKESKKRDKRRCLSLPRNLLWPGEEFLNDDDLDTQSGMLKDNENINTVRYLIKIFTLIEFMKL